MAQQVINIGAAPNDGQGTPLRNSFDITNQNFTELYNSLATGVVNSITAGTGISVDQSTGAVTISSTVTGGVTSIIAGSNISIDQSTGAVTISASGGTPVMVAGTGTCSIYGNGMMNSANGNYSFLGGGAQNQADGAFSVVGGGNFNENDGFFSFVGGGTNNFILSPGAYTTNGFIGGGEGNSIYYASRGTIGGGSQNAIQFTECSSILGGALNTNGPIPGASTNTHLIGSNLSTAVSNYTFVNNICNVGGGTSDARLKENIKPLTIGLQELSGLEPVEYNFIDDESKRTKYGFLAQNVQSVMPSLITYHPIELVDGEPVLQFDKDAVWSSMVNALKEIQERIVKLENK